VQQELCLPGVVEHFLGDAGDASKLRRCFAAQYSMQGLSASGQAAAGADVGTLAAIDSATRDGSSWVLKPQREGGGNNLYGAALSQFLASNRATPAALAPFVLMQRIFPKPRLAAFLRQGELKILPSISELGIYGTFMGDGEAEPLLNEVAGYLLRTKPAGVDEGGVATGYSVLSSVVLTNE
jgi:glutathione synthase